MTCTWNGLTPAAGVQSVQFVVLPPASLPAATIISNTATTASQTFDPALGNNVATVAAVLSVAADVRVVKTGPTSVVLGQNVVYAIQVTNAGPSDAAGVSLADVTPPGLRFVSTSGDCTASFPCALGTLTPGAARTITATFNVPLTYAGADPVANTAMVTSPTPDPVPGNNSSTATTSLIGVADIAITKTVDDTTPIPGQVLNFRISVANLGPSTATNVVVLDALPSALAWLAATPSQGSYDAATGLWTVGTIANGGVATLDLVARAGAPGLVTNVATRTSADQPDPDSSNNAAGVALTTQPSADLQVLVSASAPSAAVGEAVLYTVRIRNAGPSLATAALTRLTAPSGVTVTAVTPAAGTTFTAADAEWLIPSLAVGDVVTLVVSGIVNATGVQSLIAVKIAQTRVQSGSREQRQRCGHQRPGVRYPGGQGRRRAVCCGRPAGAVHRRRDQ